MKWLLRRLFYRLRFARRRIVIGSQTKISPRATLATPHGGSIRIGQRCEVMQYAQILSYGGDIVIGDDCSINPFCVLYGHGNLRIGNGVRIATHSSIIPANHVFADRNRPIHLQGLSKKGITIDDDVWIGAGVTIVDGVHVARGCVIGAGTVLTRSTQPYGIYVGNPGRRIRERSSKAAS